MERESSRQHCLVTRFPQRALSGFLRESIEFRTPAIPVPAFSITHDAPSPAALYKGVDMSLQVGVACPTAEDRKMVVGSY